MRGDPRGAEPIRQVRALSKRDLDCGPGIGSCSISVREGGMDSSAVSFFRGTRPALTRLILGSLAWAANAGFAPAQAAELKPVARDGLCVTNGAVALLPGGLMRIDTASSRAVVPASGGRGAEIRFRYLGPSTETKPLASGELRRQIGLKLRAQDTCNLVYAMWHIEPDGKLGVSVKRNPGKQTHEECHADGYVTVRPGFSAPVPKLAVGEWHDLRADLRATELTLFADGATVWRGALPAVIDEFDGPSGLRTDNARFEFEFLSDAGPLPRTAAPRCETGPGD
jgi:hypothetical protein